MAVARALVAHGVALRSAHAILNRLSNGDAPVVEVFADPLEAAIGDLQDLGLTVSEIRRPTAMAKDVRQSLGLTQKEFATRFGLELRTIQNWEQRHHGFDAATSLLLALIRDRPDAVDEILARPRRRP